MDKIKNVELIIVDTAGKASFKSVIPSDYKTVDGVFIMYDVSNRASFDKVNKYFEETKCEFASKNLARFLIGAKKDILTGTNVL